MRLSEENTINHWSLVKFGDLKWRVIDIRSRENKMLVISDEIIDSLPFSRAGYSNSTWEDVSANGEEDVTWENCSLRDYLNGEFYNAFSDEDKSRIYETEINNDGNLWYEIDSEPDTTDKIFLLSLEEADMYFGNSYDYLSKRGHYYSISADRYVSGGAITHVTNDFDNNRVAKDKDGWSQWWWLRSTGDNYNSAALVDDKGRIDAEGQYINTKGGLRPAMWIKLQEGMREEAMEEHNGKTSEILRRMSGLAGLAEFKSYMHELEAARPLMSKWAKRMDFPIQHFLFAVDPGNGCSTAAELLHEYLNATELYGKHPSNYKSFALKEMEFIRFPDDNNNLQTTEYMKTFPDEVKSAASGVLVLNIEDWLNHLESETFADMLDICWDMRNQISFIFTVPYLDEGVLTRVHARLQDILNVRLMHFHPYTDDELIDALKSQLSEFEMSIDDSAIPFITHLLYEERNDRRFYGMQTVSRLGTELVLMKTRNVSLKLNDAPANVLTEDDFDMNDVIIDEKPAFEQLDELIGLGDVKKRVHELVASFKADKQFSEKDSPPCYHMVFTGSPGTGKTTVARIIGKIFRESGLLRIGDLLEVNRFDLVGEYIGQTGPKTVERCRAAFGSILFIDEAYLLVENSETSSRDFGREAIGALVAEMENNRDKFVVIMAGYEDDMDRMFKANAGLRGRIPHNLHFSNYTREELFEIFKMQVNAKHECDDELLEKAQEFFNGLTDEFMNSKEFGNARFVRNLVERLRIKALLRLQGDITSMPTGQKLPLIATDLESAIADEDMSGINKKDNRRKIGFFADVTNAQV